MATAQKQELFEKLTQSRFEDYELDWLQKKVILIENRETIDKFNVFFSLSSRFISKDKVKWNSKDIILLNEIYPGINKGIWTKQDLARVILMIHLKTSKNKFILENLFEIAEMNELVALYKGLYLLENSNEFIKRFEEGIRTNMVNVFDAIAAGNPFAHRYLNEGFWNQMLLKALFLDRPLYKIQNIDKGRNINLANMLQDYIKERWSANRSVSPEIWRMINGYLREDIKVLILSKDINGLEEKALGEVLKNKNMITSKEFWDNIGKLNNK